MSTPRCEPSASLGQNTVDDSTVLMFTSQALRLYADYPHATTVSYARVHARVRLGEESPSSGKGYEVFW
jgi:hypothetical protein